MTSWHHRGKKWKNTALLKKKITENTCSSKLSFLTHLINLNPYPGKQVLQPTLYSFVPRFFQEVPSCFSRKTKQIREGKREGEGGREEREGTFEDNWSKSRVPWAVRDTTDTHTGRDCSDTSQVTHHKHSSRTDPKHSLELRIPKEEEKMNSTRCLPNLHFIEKNRKKETKIKPTTNCSIWGRVPEQFSRQFQTHSFPCLPAPWGPAAIPAPETLWIQLPSSPADFQTKSPSLCMHNCPPEQQACLWGLQGWIDSPHLRHMVLSHPTPQASVPPHAAHPLPYFIPKPYSHDRNKWAEGTSHLREQ